MLFLSRRGSCVVQLVLLVGALCAGDDTEGPGDTEDTEGPGAKAAVIAILAIEEDVDSTAAEGNSGVNSTAAEGNSGVNSTAAEGNNTIPDTEQPGSTTTSNDTAVEETIQRDEVVVVEPPADTADQGEAAHNETQTTESHDETVVVSDKELKSNPAFNISKLFPTKPPPAHGQDTAEETDVLVEDKAVVVEETSKQKGSKKDQGKSKPDKNKGNASDKEENKSDESSDQSSDNSGTDNSGQHADQQTMNDLDDNSGNKIVDFDLTQSDPVASEAED